MDHSLELVLRLKVSGAIPPPPYALMAYTRTVLSVIFSPLTFIR